MNEWYAYFLLHPWFAWVVVITLMAWTVFWKAGALWIAARDGKRWWFLALIVINSLGLLEIVYIYGFSKKSDELKKMITGKF